MAMFMAEVSLTPSSRSRLAIQVPSNGAPRERVIFLEFGLPASEAVSSSQADRICSDSYGRKAICRG